MLRTLEQFLRENRVAVKPNTPPIELEDKEIGLTYIRKKLGTKKNPVYIETVTLEDENVWQSVHNSLIIQKPETVIKVMEQAELDPDYPFFSRLPKQKNYTFHETRHGTIGYYQALQVLTRKQGSSKIILLYTANYFGQLFKKALDLHRR